MTSYSQSFESILPTPDATFFNNPNPLAENIIEKYAKSYFTVTQPTKIIKTTSADHQEGVRNCHTRTEYGNISTETYTCDMQFDQIFRFENYTFEEVNRIVRILLKDDEYNHWVGNKYGQDGTGCYVEIMKEKDKIIINFGCSC